MIKSPGDLNGRDLVKGPLPTLGISRGSSNWKSHHSSD
jgi:hypothetical protein